MKDATAVFETTSSNRRLTIKTWLYGPVNDVRLENEKKDAQRRADQLS